MEYRRTNADLRSIERRQEIKPRHHPYFTPLPGLRNAHLGYRKPRRNSTRTAGGTWLLRYRLNAKYKSVAFAQADDQQIPANGNTILSFEQAAANAARIFSERTAKPNSSSAQSCSEDTYTVGQCVADYLDRLEYDGKPIDDPLWRIRTHIEPKLKNRICSELTSAELRTWRDTLVKEPPRVRSSSVDAKPDYREVDMQDPEVLRKRRASVNRTLCVLRTALNYAFDSDILNSDVAWRKLHGFKGVETTSVDFLAAGDIASLLDACEPQFRAIVQAALLTGCYYGELQRIRVRDFDAAGSTLRIPKSTGGNERRVALTPQGHIFFASCCKFRGANDIVFLRRDGEPWAAGHQTRRMRQACEAAGIRPAINFTGLRHTYAAHLVMSGVPMAAVANNLGHRDTRMCERHFGHLLQHDGDRIIHAQSQEWLSFDADVSNAILKDS